MTELTAGEIARIVGGRLEGEESAAIRGVAPLERAGPEELSFVANARYAGYLHGTRAGVVLGTATLLEGAPEGLTRIVVDEPHHALYRALMALHPPRPREAGAHPSAVIHPSASLPDTVAVGAYAVVEAGVEIGDGTSIGAHAVIGEGVRIGRDCAIHPQVTIYPGVAIGDRCAIHSGARIGREGFGFVWLDGGHRRVPQVGGCILEDDVEVGANATVDRGSVGDTVLGAGTKVDGMVHVGHNVKIGRHVILAAQVGLSGSATLGDGVVLGGQVGVSGHLTIGPGARVGGQAGVIGSLAGGETYSGYPARPHREALRAQSMIFRLPELLKRIRALEKAIFGSGE